MHGIGQRRQVIDLAEEVGILHGEHGGVVVQHFHQVDDFAAAAVADDADVAALMVGADDLAVLRVNGVAEDDFLAFVAGDFQRHGDGFGQAGGAVVVAGVGGVHAGQGAHHALVFVGRLQRALRYLRLVRRVSRVEFAAQQDVVNHRRNEMMIGASAAKDGEVLPVIVRLADGQHFGGYLHLAHGRRQVQRGKAVCRRHHFKQIFY